MAFASVGPVQFVRVVLWLHISAAPKGRPGRAWQWHAS